MNLISSANCVELLVSGMSPDYISPDGKRFYKQMTSGPLAYYHCVAGPARDSSYSGIDLYGPHLEQYKDFTRIINGCILFDKLFSLFSIGEEFSRSFRLEDQCAYRLEDENKIFGRLSPEQIALRDRKIGVVHLMDSYNITLDPSGTCFLKNGNSTLASFPNMDSAVCKIISSFVDFVEFPSVATGVELQHIESSLRNSG